MIDHNVVRSQTELDALRAIFASEFVRSVEARLRRLSDQEVNALYLLTHTDWLEGEPVDVWDAVLMPVVEREWELRRDISVVPYIGPAIAPELHRKGGGHYVPF